MVDLLPGVWSLSPLGALIGVLVLFFWLLSTGRLIQKSSHERELALATKRGDEAMEAARASRRALDEALEQNRLLIESNRITDAFFRSATPKQIDEATGGGGANVPV